MIKPLISIVIPTKNRQKYCIEAVKQVLSLNIPEIEVCVQDNSDDNSLGTVISSLEQVVYNYHPGILSFVDNFSEAVSLASGDFLCMIGDDDGVLSNILEVTKYMMETGLDALIPGLNSVYFWPSENPINESYRNGYLINTPFRSNKRKINPLDGVKKLNNNGALNYTNYDLPRLYHGIVRKTILEEIKKVTGSYFKGLTPDIYMATALSFVCKNVVRVDFPITISGICPTSGSTDSATGRHTGRLKDAPHFRGQVDYVWDKRIPAFYSVETIWAETYIKALIEFKCVELLGRFNLAVLYSECMRKYPQFKNAIIEASVVNNLKLSSSSKQFPITKFSKKIHNIIFRLLYGKSISYFNVENIKKAADITIKNMSKIYLT